MEELYQKLRSLVKPKYVIEMKDGANWLKGEGEVIITDPSPHNNYWTHFIGPTIKTALTRAVDKLSNPDKDYVALDGTVWDAKGRSCFGAEHIRGFLVDPPHHRQAAPGLFSDGSEGN